jgi:predicted thioesterase
MTRRIAFVVSLCIASAAHADKGLDSLSITQFDPASPVAPISSVEGEGIKIGEGTHRRAVIKTKKVA